MLLKISDNKVYNGVGPSLSQYMHFIKLNITKDIFTWKSQLWLQELWPNSNAKKTKTYYNMVEPQICQLHLVWASAECNVDFSVEIIWKANFEKQNMKQQILSMASDTI